MVLNWIFVVFVEEMEIVAINNVLEPTVSPVQPILIVIGVQLPLLVTLNSIPTILVLQLLLEVLTVLPISLLKLLLLKLDLEEELLQLLSLQLLLLSVLLSLEERRVMISGNNTKKLTHLSKKILFTNLLEMRMSTHFLKMLILQNLVPCKTKITIFKISFLIN
jgi:hypothetical protein